MFWQHFIKRLILSTVIAIAAMVGGMACLYASPIVEDLKPKPPAIHVITVYLGADPKVVEKTVATPIEHQMKGVEGLLSMSSTCSSDGRYSLTVIFREGTDLDEARMLVQKRVAIAEPQLPEAVRRQGITVK